MNEMTDTSGEAVTEDGPPEALARGPEGSCGFDWHQLTGFDEKRGPCPRTGRLLTYPHPMLVAPRD